MNSRYCFKQKTYAIIGLFALLFLFTYISTVAYSALNSTLTITGDAIARIEKDIRVSNVKLLSVSGSGIELYSADYSADTITTGVQLDTLSSKVTYQVTVKNNSNKPMTIGQIKFGTYSNSKMTYDCDFETYTKIDSKSSITLNITFRYDSSVTSLPSDKVLQSTINFIFEEMPKPVLARSNTWYKGSTSRNSITSISIEDNYTVPLGKTVIESWDASEGEKKSVTAYILDDYSLVLSGNGEGNGKVIANSDSRSAFGDVNSSKAFNYSSFFDMSLLDTSNVINMNGMFGYAGRFNVATTKIIGLENFDVSNVTDMSYLFTYAGNSSDTLIIDNIDNWNVSNVTTMSGFAFLSGTNSTVFDIGDLSNWNTSSVISMDSMFSSAGKNAASWDIGDLDNWDVSKVTTMSSMFNYAGYNASTWNIGTLSNWDTGKVTSMSYMFAYSGYKSSTWNIGTLNDWDTGNVTSMSYMFAFSGYSAGGWGIGYLNSWNVSNVQNFSDMFARAAYSSDIFDLGDIGGWDISNAKNLSWMFFDVAPKATLWSIGQLNDWNTSKVTDMNRLFYSSGKNSTVWDIGDLSNWDTSKVTNMSLMFDSSGKKIESWNVGDISGWDVSNLKSTSQMFANLSNLKILDLSGWNTSSLTDTSSMFSWCDNLTTIYISDGWDVSNVTSSVSMFNAASKLPNYEKGVYDATKAHGDAGGYMTRVVRFSIEGKYYKALPGMTWLDWIQSEYSAGSDMKSWGYCVGTTSFDYYLVNGSKMVSPSDTITSSNYQLLLN